jgi:hypothetical protein
LNIDILNTNGITEIPIEHDPLYRLDATPYTTKYLLISGVADAMLSAVLKSMATWIGDDMRSFTVNIKEMRTQLKWSQEDLAREVGVSLSTIQRIHNK